MQAQAKASDYHKLLFDCNSALTLSYQPLPPPPPPPPPEDPPPPLPEDEPGAVEEAEMAPAKELPRLLVKLEVWKLSQELPEYQTGE